MATIEKEQDVFTVMLTYKVKPEDQEKVIEIAQGFATIANEQPGFISSSIHRSVDVTRVMNYGQWDSSEAYKLFMENKELQESIPELARLVRSNKVELEWKYYEVVNTFAS